MTQSYFTATGFADLGKVDARQDRDVGALVWIKLGSGCGLSLALSIADAEKLVVALPDAIAHAKRIKAVADAVAA